MSKPHFRPYSTDTKTRWQCLYLGKLALGCSPKEAQRAWWNLHGADVAIGFFMAIQRNEEVLTSYMQHLSNHINNMGLHLEDLTLTVLELETGEDEEDNDQPSGNVH